MVKTLFLIASSAQSCFLNLTKGNIFKLDLAVINGSAYRILSDRCAQVQRVLQASV